MSLETLLFYIVAGAFVLVSGANDGGTLVSSGLQMRSLSPLAAIGLLLAALVLVPPLLGTAVATTMATSLVGTVGQDGSVPRLAFLVAVLTAVLVVAALARLGLPTSLTLALIGGITGAGLGLGLPVAWRAVGVVLLIGLAAPLVGGFVAWLLIRLLRHAPIGGHASRLGWAHRSAFGAQCLAYAANDGQKALAIFAVAAGTVGPPVVPRLDQLSLIALLFGIGLLMGLPRIAATVVRRMAPPRPLQAVSAETASAIAVLGSTAFGSPVSMTQSITAALLGAGLSRGYGRIRWRTVIQLASAWFLTLPAAVGIAALAGAIGRRMWE
ncbi:MAG: inorganic phosphate transporter [Acidimicrobiales bacterium]